MKLTLRSRPALATVAAGVALLALPALAGANPGSGPELVRRSGQFVILHADGRDGSAIRQPMLVDGLRRTPVRAPGDVWIEPGSRVRLEGAMQDGTLVLGETLTAVTQLAPARLAGGLAQAPSTETTAVVQFSLSDQTTTGLPADPNATMTTDPKSLRAYYLEQTYGDISFETRMFAPVHLTQPKPTTNCTSFIDDWAEEAESLNPTLDPSQYKHIVYVFPALSPTVCGWSGIAEVGGSHVWINGQFNVAVIAHELGHNLGITHAAGLSCTSAGAVAPMGDTCIVDRDDYALPQYADPFDAMGNQPVLRQMNMPHKLALGVLPASAVATAGTSGTYTLAPMETLTGTVELLRLPKPDGGIYSVEYRRPIGVFDGQTGPSVTGVLIHTESPDMLDYNRGDSDTALIDMHPDGTYNPLQWENAALQAGETFNDPVRGIVIQNVGQTGAAATLAITMPLDTTPPGRPGRLSAVLSGTTVSLQWLAALDDREVTSYVVARDGAPLGTTAALTFTDGGAAAGATVTYTVSAVDATGNVGTPAAVSVAIPDTVAPSAPAGVTARLTRDGQVHVDWGPATDNRGVTSYRILRNGTGIGQVTAGSFVDRAPRPGSGASVTYSVVAFDLVGNAGPPGNAKPLRAALLRKLGVSRAKVVRVKGRVRVKGTLSDARAACKLHIGKGKWRPCKQSANGAFSVLLPAGGKKPVTVSLHDSLGRVKLLTLRVP
jgi:chitodextrinase